MRSKEKRKKQDPLLPFRLILASSSPRRRELLSGLGYVFDVVDPQVAEIPKPGEAPSDFALRAARDKARWVAARAEEDAIIIAGDTVVTIHGAILGKPVDEADARRMLGQLSGHTHKVITGLFVLRVGKTREYAEAVVTEVTFKALNAAEIDAYIATGEPMDKAGAYGIQGGANYMVREIQGSYTNVIGLPLTELVEALTNLTAKHAE